MARQRTKFVITASPALAGSAPSNPIEEPVVVDSSSIAALAYQLWHARGCPDGSPEIDWFQAERELHNQSAKQNSSATKEPLLARQVGA